MNRSWERSVPFAPEHAPRWRLIAVLLALVFLGGVASQPTGNDWFNLVAIGSANQVRDAIDAGANINARDNYGSTALMHAARYNSEPAILTVLLDAGADIDARDNTGWTALMWAARSNSVSAVTQLLLDAGADIDARDNTGWTALMWAARDNSEPAVPTVLLDAGADTTITNNAGRRAIDYARDNQRLNGTDTFWRIHDASFD